ncbi:NUDIX domain-containing protein [Nocardioides dubius]|uniref:NUDIX hydrolase n=1 Tax=Nocardioides dubius TaxID=317019 RepID=A0ABP4EK58_9ACTN
MSLHADATATLSRWHSDDARQSALREELLGHLSAHPDGVWRSCFPAHLTAGTLVLSEDAEQVLLNLHGKAQRWFAFGGHCEDGDATLAGVAAREAREESGLAGFAFDPVPVHIDVHEVGFCDPRGTVRHLDVRFVATVPADAAHDVSEESLDVRWWPLDALPDDLGDEMHELIAVSRARVLSR